jgi:fumarate hydratase class II
MQPGRSLSAVEGIMNGFRKEMDSLGEVDVPTLKKAAANSNHAGGRLDDHPHKLIVEICDEILDGQHHDRDTDVA